MKFYYKRFILIWLLFLWCKFGFGQAYTINGPSCVVVGQTYTYTFGGAYPTNPALYAYIIGGIMVGNTNSSIDVIWNASPTGSLTIYYTTTVSKTVSIANTPSFTLNSFTTDNGLVTGVSITGSESTATGCTFSYQWESGNSAFFAISGATGKDLVITNNNTATLNLRRYAYIAGDLSTIAYSQVISFQAKTILPGQDAGTLTPATLATCSSGTTSYYWSVSTDGINWNSVSNISQSYSPGVLTATRYYRLEISCPTGRPSISYFKVSVAGPLVPGTINGISASIPYGTLPGTLTNQALPSGSSCSSYAFQWQQSTDGTNYVNIPGATDGAGFSPDKLYRPTYFRRAVTCGGQTLYSNAVFLQPVPDALYGGTINPSSVYLSQVTNTFLFSGIKSPQGGCLNAAYQYQWQQSVDNITFSNITGATVANYQTGALDKSTYFRRMVTCGGQTAYSNTAYVVKVDLENYVREWEGRIGGLPDNVETLSDVLRSVGQSTRYFDGLGRESQSVLKKSSLITGQQPFDLVKESEYDNRGRQARQYLPFASTGNDGAIKLNPRAQQQSYYTTQLAGEPGGAGTDPAYAFTRIKFEVSPQSREKETFMPGTNWAGTADNAVEVNRRALKVKYLMNTVTDEVRIWNVTDVTGGLGTYASPGAYGAGTLYKYISTDENGKQNVEFKDKEGNVVLRKVALTATDAGAGSGHTGWLSTYYIYDHLNNLRCVIQPEGVKALPSNSWALTATLLEEQCFRYEYDAKRRTIHKKIPGAGISYMVYDIRGRLIMSQDANLRQAGKWLVMLYDGQNRPVQTGLWTNAGNQASHAAAATTITYPFSVSNTPAIGYERLSQTGYDNYSALPSGSGLTSTFDNSEATYFYSTYNSAPDYAQPLTASQATIGLLTWTETKVLNSNPVKYLYAVYIYDGKGRAIQVKTTNITNGSEVATTQFNWMGLPLIMTNKQTKAGAPVQTTVQVTRNSYDDLWRTTKIEKRIQHTLVNNNAMGPYVTVAEMEYDALGRVKNHKTGRSKDAAGNYTSTPLETGVHDYNMQGWLTGVNRSYVATTGTGRYFGWELGYDRLANFGGNNYANAQFNGNISGMIWKSKGNGVQRKYDFTYDAANRLLNATFVQRNQDGTWNSNLVNFTLKLGASSAPALTYDDNGNILGLQQWGLKSGTSTQIDNMVYTYYNGGNRLRRVSEQGSGLTDHKLGDFTDKHTGTDDFGYDLNGNLVTDLNKRLNGTTGTGLTTGGAITYNYLNLPEMIAVKDDNGNVKGNIVYVYDAAGNKLSKKVTDQGEPGKTITTTTLYLGGAVFETRTNTVNASNNYTDKLLYINHEYGRIRFAPAVGSTPARFDYDYFLKDHLGNVRMVLTDEQRTDIYQATMETAAQSFEVALFGDKINTTNAAKPAGFDSDGTNARVSVVNGNTPEDRVGPGVILKVMAGDKINARTFAWYQPSGMDNTTNTTLQNVVLNLLAQLTPGISAIGKGTAAAGVTNTVLQPGMENFLSTQQPASGAPRAYLNWVLLDDEQFKYVSGGVTPMPQITGTQEKQLLQTNGGNDIEMLRNGYVYVYVSNESKGNVYFDNIRIEHKRGAILEETHYYPYGLTMAGISSKAPGKLENRYKFNGIELNSDFDLNSYEARYRNLDPQIGRFWQVDPQTEALESYSPYESMGNNPILNIDPLGDFRTRFGAWLYSLWHGGEVHQNKYKEWYVVKSELSNEDNNTLFTLSLSYGKGRHAQSRAGEDMLDDLEDQKLKDQWTKAGIWDPNLSPDEAGKNALNMGLGVTLPSAYIKPATSAVNATKVVNTMANKTLPELQAIAKQNATLFRKLFGTGKEGAQGVLNNIKNVKAPEGLTKEAMQAYRELIKRVPDPAGTQAIRAKILDQLLK